MGCRLRTPVSALGAEPGDDRRRICRIARRHGATTGIFAGSTPDPVLTATTRISRLAGTSSISMAAATTTGSTPAPPAWASVPSISPSRTPVRLLRKRHLLQAILLDLRLVAGGQPEREYRGPVSRPWPQPQLSDVSHSAPSAGGTGFQPKLFSRCAHLRSRFDRNRACSTNISFRASASGRG